MAEVHKKSNLTSIFFVISAVIAALFIGFVGGEFVNISRQTKQEYQTIMEESQRDDDEKDMVSENSSSKKSSNTSTKADSPVVDAKKK